MVSLHTEKKKRQYVPKFNEVTISIFTFERFSFFYVNRGHQIFLAEFFSETKSLNTNCPA